MVDNKKWCNTTGTAGINSTVSNPNPKAIIYSVSSILHDQIQEDVEEGKEIPEDSQMYVFSEERYVKLRPEEFDEERQDLLRSMPSQDNIYEFIKALYDCCQFSIECCIISLVYINRIINKTQIPLQPTNWRPLVFISIIIAQKVIDDQFIKNGDFAWVYPFFDKKEIDLLEQNFFAFLDYNVLVDRKLYHQYYYQLRVLFIEHSKEEFPQIPITDEDYNKLEKKVDFYNEKNKVEEGDRFAKTQGYVNKPNKTRPLQFN